MLFSCVLVHELCAYRLLSFYFYFLFSSLPTLPVFWHMRICGLTVDVNADVRIIIIIIILGKK